ncbi:beta-propeller fold lactonase family protein [Microbacterium sp. NPDC089189]|uniref:lactonase family protein n=1 Tax=Microbacterium sp. NPDC089189 TaxID=3154972 RepID=UPI0034392EBC
MRFWVGGYTAEMDGAADGIGEIVAGGADEPLAGGQLSFGGTVAATTGSPSWLTAHPTVDVVYAALESEGAVQAFRRTADRGFQRLGAPVVAGALVCHIAVEPDGRFLLASCWGDGRLVRMRLDAAGRPSAPSVAPAAADPYAEGSMSATSSELPDADGDLAAAARALRDAAGEEFAHLVPHHDEPAPVRVLAAAPQDAEERVSRAHQSLFLPGGLVATTDMGFDLVRFWRPAGDGLRRAGEVVLPRGSGPRHMVWHPSGHLYVLTELSCEVFVLAPDASGRWRLVGGAPLSPQIRPEVDRAAELAASADDAFVYAGVRGSDTIAALRVTGDGASLRSVALAEAGVVWPRHHIIARDTLVVAGQRSNEIASITLDTRSGVPARARARVAVPSPSCLLPAR